MSTSTNAAKTEVPAVPSSQENAEMERAVLAQEVESLRGKIGLRQVDVSKECGVNASMLSQWMLGRYKGNVARINGLMETWLIRRRGGKPMDKNLLMMQSAHVSPKLKRKLDEMNDSMQEAARESNRHLRQRQAYHYPKTPAPDTILVPIRLDVDVEGTRYVDSFCWNIYESDFTYESFAATLMRDSNLPEPIFQPIVQSIRRQVEAIRPTVPLTKSTHNKESLHPILINIRIHDTIFIDRFEWDLNNESNSPDDFARIVCAECGLSGEFEAQVAFSIREQLHIYAKLLREGKQDKVTRLPQVEMVFRDRGETASFSPRVKFLLADDVQLLEKTDLRRIQSQTQPRPSTSVSSSNVMSLASARTKPPKPVNSFLMFCREQRKQLPITHPSQSAKDASKVLGEMWKNLSEKEKAKYLPMTEEENARRLEEWRRRENLPKSAIGNVQANGQKKE